MGACPLNEDEDSFIQEEVGRDGCDILRFSDENESDIRAVFASLLI